MKWITTLLLLMLSLVLNAQEQKTNNMTELHHKIEGKGQTLILIHGGGTDSRVWDSISQELVQSYQVVTYDLRGHGESPTPTDTTNHVEDLNNLMTSLNIHKATLIGHSLGGQIATDYALLHPNKVKKLVLLSPGLSGYQYDEAYQALGKEMWSAVPNVDSMLHIMLNTPDAYAMQESMKGANAEKIKQIHKANIIKSLQWKNFEQEWPIDNTADQLSELAAPTLFIVGSEDKPDLFKIKELFKKVPKIEFQEIQGADHGLLCTHTKQINNSIKVFIKE